MHAPLKITPYFGHQFYIHFTDAEGTLSRMFMTQHSDVIRLIRDNVADVRLRIVTIIADGKELAWSIHNGVVFTYRPDPSINETMRAPMVMLRHDQSEIKAFGFRHGMAWLDFHKRARTEGHICTDTLFVGNRRASWHSLGQSLEDATDMFPAIEYPPRQLVPQLEVPYKVRITMMVNAVPCAFEFASPAEAGAFVATTKKLNRWILMAVHINEVELPEGEWGDLDFRINKDSVFVIRGGGKGHDVRNGESSTALN